MTYVLPLISEPPTATEIPKRVLAQLAILAVSNGKVLAKVVKR